MKVSKEGRRLAREYFRSSFTDGKLDRQKVGRIAQAIIAAKSRGYVGILKEFHRLLRIELQKHHALVESAVPLNPETSQRVIADLRNRYGSDLSTDFLVNPELIGGLRVKIGDDVWDGSVRNRLNRLEQQLSTV